MTVDSIIKAVRGAFSIIAARKQHACMANNIIDGCIAPMECEPHRPTKIYVSKKIAEQKGSTQIIKDSVGSVHE